MDTDSLLKALSQAASSPHVQTDTTDIQRRDIYYACQKLSTSLETPIDRLMRSSFDFVSPLILRVAIDLGIFDLFNQECQSHREFDVSEIVIHTKSGEPLISRIMRFLITIHIIDVTDDGKCKANSFTKTIRPGTEIHALIIMLSTILKSVDEDSGLFIPLLGRLPEYLKHNGHTVPENPKNGVFQYAYNTESHIYDWFNKNKLEEDAFHQMMASRPSSHGGMWTDYIPDKWILEKFPSEVHSDEITIVDMGASSGNVLDAVKRRLPSESVRLILQDLEDVTEGKHHATSLCQTKKGAPENIEKMKHNFFDPQPVEGANIYILARALHNWPDKEALMILQHIQVAMNQHSTLLIYDCVFPDRLEVISYNDVASDMVMMAALASLERTEGHIKKLLHSVGLKVVNVWRSPQDDDKQAILEIVREDQPST
ncbi:hypothetical protein N7520_008514 [Penicillium odoratum]|uniref:uncharacterized protein n=1 Tax=Penicillium odoratum TaxID=1167516 RepID=UPI0025469863|nr:uncharacterized protein N7520_008514 [Penicillium odoratum]KAJ5751597.1 hypothetical protein N7520_008514 [Penicillium odoratum]